MIGGREWPTLEQRLAPDQTLAMILSLIAQLRFSCCWCLICIVTWSKSRYMSTSNVKLMIMDKLHRPSALCTSESRCVPCFATLDVTSSRMSLIFGSGSRARLCAQYLAGTWMHTPTYILSLLVSVNDNHSVRKLNLVNNSWVIFDAFSCVRTARSAVSWRCEDGVYRSKRSHTQHQTCNIFAVCWPSTLSATTSISGLFRTSMSSQTRQQAEGDLWIGCVQVVSFDMYKQGGGYEDQIRIGEQN